MHQQIQSVTERIQRRSRETRVDYLNRMGKARGYVPQRQILHCGNLAHGFAACTAAVKSDLREMIKANIAIISAYNDMLSAHQPYAVYPERIKRAVIQAGGVAQFAGGVPAMCDGVTQGQLGMELSLLSRDVIALSSAIALSHNMFDGGLMLGVCDKIVPGLLIAALSFGHLPFVFVPAGPMPSGISNLKKAKIRERYAEGKIDKTALLESETAAYHAPGTCTFYGTANSNQLVVEMMGLQLPGSSFVPANSPLRDALTEEAARCVLGLTDLSGQYLPISQILDAKAIVNGIVGLLASGGSTNHTIHLVAIARAAGWIINWNDFSDLSRVTPLIAHIYPNGQFDINHFHQAGGMSFFIHTLLEAGLLHEEVHTVAGFGLKAYTRQPVLIEDRIVWQEGAIQSLNMDVLKSVQTPFKSQGGLQALSGNIGRAIIKTSALKDGQILIEAPAVVFLTQDAFNAAFKAGDLDQDCVVVLPFQGPKACGMPELHQLTPALSVLIQRGFRVALVTDGRMSGASGKVPAAIHVTPEAIDGGTIAKIKTGDIIRIDSEGCVFDILISSEELAARMACVPDLPHPFGMGRELFSNLRRALGGAEQGASVLYD